jgi:hypothetical protein
VENKRELIAWTGGDGRVQAQVTLTRFLVSVGQVAEGDMKYQTTPAGIKTRRLRLNALAGDAQHSLHIDGLADIALPVAGLVWRSWASHVERTSHQHHQDQGDHQGGRTEPTEANQREAPEQRRLQDQALLAGQKHRQRPAAA